MNDVPAGSSNPVNPPVIPVIVGCGDGKAGGAENPTADCGRGKIGRGDGLTVVCGYVQVGGVNDPTVGCGGGQAVGIGTDDPTAVC